ncbi:hypothetical protein AciX9_4302 (plasmid) [Granulicella tundricola MP5ACTX9]|uniref:Uncharacterized protein n=1 Tax=Granulicella tundricola (strain ATCC BAA-1859 / DSM 23138 / MP5ACTX9) TaxID=1198114 RepID=E8X6I6_GRATM|nr:hypothetical protein AciX9_4302 [Granulicella tundricola MP5ACTX9]
MPVHLSYIRKVNFKIFPVLAFAVSLTSVAVAQDTLVKALKQKYRVTEINSQGVAANPGTVLTIEADGINAEPYPTMITFENPVVDGQVKQRSKGLGFLKSNNLQILQPGQKVYITKINEDTQGKEDALKLTILTSDAVLATYTNGTYGSQYQAAKRYSTTLSFKEPKGTLAQMSVDDASKMIEAVLSVNAGDQVRTRDAGTIARSCEPHCAVSATTGAPVGGAGITQAAPQSAPPTVALGQTPAQVTATMGAPAQIIDLGAKQIYKYPDMKIIFVNGKVSDVQ